MPKITLLGDSIRVLGYGAKVEKHFKEKGYKVYQPVENCRFAKYTMWGVMCDWITGIVGSDIIHWNNGSWDCCDWGEGAFTQPDEYVSHILRVAELLQKQAKMVIFATTTPVSERNVERDNARIAYYNELVVPKLREMGIIINDLHAVVAADIDKYICEDDVHLSEAGIDVCAEQVIKVISEAIEKEKTDS